MIGQTLSHYRVLEKLGSGCMGEVYVAEERSSAARWRSRCCRLRWRPRNVGTGSSVLSPGGHRAQPSQHRYPSLG